MRPQICFSSSRLSRLSQLPLPSPSFPPESIPSSIRPFSIPVFSCPSPLQAASVAYAKLLSFRNRRPGWTGRMHGITRLAGESPHLVDTQSQALYPLIP